MSQSEYKIHNLEASILYIQEEHARILKQLHEEIKDLQMKNNELTFHMAMRDLAVPQESREPEDFQDLLDQIRHLQSEVARLSSENSDKLKQIDSQDTKIRLLTGTIDKLKESQRAQMSAVELELNNKSAEIVLLSTKLHNWKKLEVSNRPTVLGDEAASTRSCCRPPLLGPPTIPTVSVFKLRNQVSVHPDDGHAMNRPTVARHTLVAASYPVKTSTVNLNPECAVSREERVNFSKLIRRPNILPPINSVRHVSLAELAGRRSPRGTHDSSQGSRESLIDSPRQRVAAATAVTTLPGNEFDCFVSSTADTETNNHNRSSATVTGKRGWVVSEQTQARLPVDIDRVMEVTVPPGSTSSLVTPPIRCSEHRYHPSPSSSSF